MPGVLILACGNPSRGDDALGPLLIERLSAIPNPNSDLRQAFDLETDFQLQIEHVLDMQGHRLVVFVDAAITGTEPFSFEPVTADSVPTITTHAMSPGALLQVYEQVIGGGSPPDCRLLAIRGYAFDLGAGLSPGAAANLEAALAFLPDWLRHAS